MKSTDLSSDENEVTWQEFTEQVRDRDFDLLRRLDEFPDSILVTGCQRSGTTMVARLITESEGMVKYWFGYDDELDAAMILSGFVDHQPRGRYCFQTTYMNERYHEYFDHPKGHKIIWIIRNPASVVYSMLNNWGTHNPNRVFKTCGVPYLSGIDKWRYKIFGLQGVSMLRRACWGYIGKTKQIFDLKEKSVNDNFIVMDYDELVMHKYQLLPKLYKFIELEYKSEYADKIHSKSLNKKELLSRSQIKTIESLCNPIYQEARKLACSPVQENYSATYNPIY